MPAREFNLTDLNGINGFTINGIGVADASGYSVASAGDVNADGFDDLIVGADRASLSGRANIGRSYLVFNQGGVWPNTLELSTLNGTTGVKINGIEPIDRSGTAVASAGDFNDDGVGDIIIAAITANPGNRTNAGQAYVIFGHPGIWRAEFELSSLNGTNGVAFNGDQGGSAGDRIISVASAGDANNDSISDIIIGSYLANPVGRTDAGITYMVFGRGGVWPASLELSSLNGTTGVKINGITESDENGRSLAAYDMNADGISDVIIGAHRADPFGRIDAGQTYLLFGRNGTWPASINLSTINSTMCVVISGVVAGDRSGTSVASAGDVNGDRIDDIIIGAQLASPDNQTNAGQSYIVFGRNTTWPSRIELSSLNGVTGVTLNGATREDFSGISVGLVGDINDDDVDDIIIGAGFADPDGMLNAGKTYVVFGHNGSWPATLGLSSLDGISGVVINGKLTGDQSGRSVASVGDVNDDGITDIIIGAPQESLGRNGVGQAYVIFGGAEKFSANQIEIQSGQMIRLNQSNFAVDPIIGNRTFTVTNTSHINFVSTYNISAPLSNFTQQQINDGGILAIHDGSREEPSYTVSAEGITRVFSDVHPQQGNVSLSIGTPRVNAPHREFNLSDLNGVNGFIINGNATGDNSGFSVASAGDVNGDEIDDVIIGASNADPSGRSNAGQSYLVFGRNASWPRSLELSVLNGITGTIINGIAAGDGCGTKVAPVGDVNGDGFDDVVIGSISADPGGREGAGQSYLLFGHNNTWANVLELSSLDGQIGVIFNGISAGDQSGRGIAGGDVNGDGFSDVLIGARYADPNDNVNAGQSYIVFGHNETWPAVLELSSLNGINGSTIQGVSEQDQTGFDLASGRDVNNDGYDDVLISAHWSNPGNRTAAGQTRFLFGHNGQWPAYLNMTSSELGFREINGITNNDRSGVSVDLIGDVNGDNFGDLVLGAWAAGQAGREEVGQSYFVFGNNNTFSDTLELSELNGVTGTVINGIRAGDYSGRSVASVGDMNGDGINDVIIGAFGANPNGRADAGQSYLLFGRIGAWPATLELASLNIATGITLNGIASNDGSGFSVAFAGDVNGDGFDDVIIGTRSASPDNRTEAGQSYVVFGGAEQFSANEIEIERNETLILNASNIEIDPNIGSRIINVTDIEHGQFALVSNQSTAINTFNQSQVNNGEVIFVHDGSDQAPGYTVSAESITRVFSNVHPQAANVSFIVSDAPTSAPTITPTAIPTLAPMAIPTIAPTTVPTVAPSALPTSLPTVALIAVPTIAPTTVPSLNPTSFFGVPTDVPTMAPVSVPTSAPTIAPFSISPTAQIDPAEETVTSDGGGDSDSGALVGGVAGGLIAVVALLLVGFFYYRRRQNEERKKVVQGVTGDEVRTVAMTLNPAFVAGANTPDAIASGEGVGYDPVAQYESPKLVSGGTDSSVLDEDNYVAQTGGTVIITGADGATYAVPMATDDGAAGIPAADNQYRVFRSVGADGGSEVDPNAGSGNGNDTYHVFRSASATSSVT